MLRRTGLAVALASMLLAGCGADQAAETTTGSADATQPASELAVTDEPTEATEEEPTEATEEEPTEATEEEPTEATEEEPTEATETESEAAAAKDKKQGNADGRRKVAIRDFRFRPKKTEVSAGTTIRWTNFDGAAHTVTFDSGPDSGSLEPDDTFTATFRKPGTYAYTCEFHPFVMDGTVVVTG